MRTTIRQIEKLSITLVICLLITIKVFSQVAKTTKDTVVYKTGYVTVNDAKLFYREAGEGQPILFLHGSMATDERHFPRQLSEFATKNRVIALHLRAHGKSTFPNAPFSMDLFTDDVFKFLNEMQIDSAIVVGFSLGGVIGIDLAAKHPQKVKKLVTIGAFTRFDARPENTIKDIANWGDDILNFIKANFKDSPEPEKIPLYLQNLKKMLLENKEPNMTDEHLQKIKCPTLLFYGDNDYYSKLDHQLYLKKMIEKSSLCVLPQTPHNVQNAQAEIFNKLLWDFLKM